MRSVHEVRSFLEYEVFHARVGELLSRLAEQGTTRVVVLSQQAVPLTVNAETEGFSAEQIAPFIYLLTVNN